MTPSGKTKQQPTKAQEISNKKTNEASPPSIVGTQNNPDNPNGQSHNKKQNSNRKWEPLTFFTMLLVIVGFIQAVTMWHTVSDSRKTQRAFVYVTKFNYMISDNELIVQPVWENSGTTPTRQMLNSVSYKRFDDKESIDNYSFPDLDENGIPRKDNSRAIPLYINPKGTIFGGAAHIPHEDVIKASKGQCKIFVYGWTEYNDIFYGTPRHRTEFCRQIAIPAKYAVGSSVMDILYKRHNCSDDDCK